MREREGGGGGGGGKRERGTDTIAKHSLLSAQQLNVAFL